MEACNHANMEELVALGDVFLVGQHVEEGSLEWLWSLQQLA